MKHIIELPDEIEQALERRALATGDDVDRLIEAAVISFAIKGGQTPRVGRLPDRPLGVIETASPCDLPRTAPRSIAIELQSQRFPDPIVETA